mgnify:CR=1 FL=1
MRKAQKEQAIELIGLLGRAHEGIRMTIETGQREEALNLLEQCQDVAIHLGEDIEREEGEGAPAVTALEEYCEAVYQVYEKLSKGQTVNGHKAYKTLRKSLIQIENSVKSSKVRTEAVFLPYKASMWDSLESVWKAAQEAPDCDAYVIPIPYFDKNPDGSFREEHYEANLYPDDVPVTGYQDYDFAERRPYFIFIHNPYDECNYVTSVHPFFYAKNLKQFTEKLVYIPYFILGEVDPENKHALEGISHFCTVPGVIYADRVIVQSEAMRKAYINIMTEYLAEKGYEREYWEKKILGLGSPKIDKVLQIRKEDQKIPAEWLKIIEKEDGSWKKILFYNTSVTALLQHGDRMLEKIQDVLRLFKEKADEFALLWRPHPLIQATIESMRPQLWKKYKELVDEYRMEGWGIYDDSADMDRAVVLCDGYYGDGSSLVQLVKIRKKPALIQNCSVRTRISNEEEVPFLFENCVEVNGYLWFPIVDFNGLAKMNLVSGGIEYVGQFPEEPYSGVRLYTSMLLDGKKIIFIPGSAERISIFDTENNAFQTIELPDDIKALDLYGSDCKIACAELYKGYLYLFTPTLRIYKMACQTGSVTQLLESENMLAAIRKEQIKEKENFYSGGVCAGGNGRIEGRQWIPLFHTNKLFIYDYTAEKAQILEIPEASFEINTACILGNKIYCFSQEDICVFDPLEGKFDMLAGILTGDCEKQEPAQTIAIGQALFFTDYTRKRINIFDSIRSEVKELWRYEGNIYEFSRYKEGMYFLLGSVCGKWMFSSAFDYCLYSVDSMNRQVKKIKLTIPLQPSEARNKIRDCNLTRMDSAFVATEGGLGIANKLDVWLDTEVL